MPSLRVGTGRLPLLNGPVEVRAPSTLLDDLIEHWKLDEASGTRLGSKGIVNLTDVNTVTQAAGKIGSAAQFTAANSEYLSAVDPPELSFTDEDFTFAGWVWLDSKVNPQTMVGKWEAGTNNREYVIQWFHVSDRFQFFVSNDGVNAVSVTANNFGAPTVSTWNFLVCWHDSVANTLNIQVNNGTVDTLSYSAGCFNGTASFNLGRQGTAGIFTDGRQDAWSAWHRVLTTDEKTALWNGGAGVEWPF